MAGKPSMMQVIFLQLVCCLGWLSGIALAQLEFSEALMGSVNITDVGITCLSNAAVFITSLLRGRLYLEMGARDAMAALTGPAKFEGTNEHVSTCESENDYKYASVVMLSNSTSNSSIRLFMKYMYNFHNVRSILREYKSSVGIVSCSCSCCNCIVVKAEGITGMLEGLNPSIYLKPIDNSWYLLPSRKCVTELCHGLDQIDSDAAVYDTLDSEFTIANREEPLCICIPVNPAVGDNWIKVLMKSFKSKDEEDSGAIVMASVALENYLSNSPEKQAEEVFYSTSSLIVPRIIEILINIALTVWIKLDGFSSALVARKAVKNHVVNSTGNGFVANAFLTGALVKSNAGNTNVCQVLRFIDGNLRTLKTLSIVVGCVNLICSIIWATRVGFGGGAAKWYKITSIQPSIPRISVIMAAIFIGWVMDCLDFCWKKLPSSKNRGSNTNSGLRVVVIILEMACIVVYGCAVTEALDINRFGRWVYSALQGLVWLKWGLGCYLLKDYSSKYDARSSVQNPHGRMLFSAGRWADNGTLVYSSSFFLNAVLAGVRGWK